MNDSISVLGRTDGSLYAADQRVIAGGSQR